MLICGLKMTHDGTVAVIDGNRLVFATEMEKVSERSRFSAIEDGTEIAEVLAAHGYSPADMDEFVVDGWGAMEPDGIGPAFDRSNAQIGLLDRGEPYSCAVARYCEGSLTEDVLFLHPFDGLRIAGRQFRYRSPLHVTGHILAAYCTSPFAIAGEDSFVLVWDGGVQPRLYYVDAGRGTIESLGPLFKLFGNAYAQFARHFPPFRGAAEHGLSTAGKVMAYSAFGEVRPTILKLLKRAVRERNTLGYGFPRKLARFVEQKLRGHGYSSADFIRTFHVYLQDLLCATLAQEVGRKPDGHRNLCLSGGCALNIKWNSAIRDLRLFDAVHVPPFPNDSGNAIGTSCAAMIAHTGHWQLDWSVYSGPSLIARVAAPGWVSRPCDIHKLAALLHESQEPIVLLHGRAELGPRALGCRSIVASPQVAAMQFALNRIKCREQYRPVSPACLEHRAPEIFDPGSRDPYMLFEHRVRPAWRARIPAVIHVDGTARLQTVSAADNRTFAGLLEAYGEISGIPVLCNTSANGPGTGFFPDVRSATEWGMVNYIWSEGLLFERKTKLAFSLPEAGLRRQAPS